jgi:hypothetical protein
LFTFSVKYINGPLDGHVEERQRPALESDLNCEDPRTGSWHHYTLRSLPSFDREPIEVEYRHVAEYDPTSSYLEEAARWRSGAGWSGDPPSR